MLDTKWLFVFLCVVARSSSSTSNNTVVCDDNNSCSGISLNDINTVICNGNASCENSTFTNVNTINCMGDIVCHASNFINTTVVNCFGYATCYYTSFINVYDLKCGGLYACYSSNVDHINTIACDENYTCLYSDFSNVNTINCSGYQGCEYSTFDIINTFICDGYWGCDGSLYTNIDNVECNEEDTCDFSTFVNITQMVIRRNDSLNHNAIISNVYNVTCLGPKSCSDGCFFDSIDNIQCIGGNSCSNKVYFDNIKNVDCNGDLSCRESVFLRNVETVTCNIADQSACNSDDDDNTARACSDLFVLAGNVANFSLNCNSNDNDDDDDDDYTYTIKDLADINTNKDVCPSGDKANDHDNNIYIVNTSTTMFCFGQYECSNTTISNIDFVFCAQAYSCENAQISNVKNTVCFDAYSCSNTNFKKIEFEGVRCCEDYSCDDVRGEMTYCSSYDYGDLICDIGDTCGYACDSCGCSVFCYGDCFSATDTKMSGIPNISQFRYPLDHLCVRYYVYLLCLMPWLIFWALFDYFYNSFFKKKFNTLLLLNGWNTLHEKEKSIIKSNSRHNAILELRYFLYLNAKITTQNKTKNKNKNKNKKKQVTRTEDSNTNDNKSKEIGDLLDHFWLTQEELERSHTWWIDELHSNVAPFIEEYFKFKIPTEVWGIIFDQYCGRSSKNLVSNSTNESNVSKVNVAVDAKQAVVIDDDNHDDPKLTKSKPKPKLESKSPSSTGGSRGTSTPLNNDLKPTSDDTSMNTKMVQERESLRYFRFHFISTKFVTKKYFDYYNKMYNFLRFYAVFKFISEVLVLLSILICFFSDKIYLDEKNGWVTYRQFVATLVNFYFVEINPLFAYLMVHFSFDQSITKQCETQRLSHKTAKGDYQQGLYGGKYYSQETMYKERYSYLMSNYPPLMTRLFEYYFIKYGIFILVFCPVIFLGFIVTLAIGGCCFCWLEDIDVIYWPKKVQQSIKIFFYVFCVVALINSTFGWIDVYSGHMWIASIGRAFLAVDQCPAPSSDGNYFNNVFEFVVWLNYWIV